MGACAILGMSNHNALGEDLESDPFLNSASKGSLANFTADLIHSLHP